MLIEQTLDDQINWLLQEGCSLNGVNVLLTVRVDNLLQGIGAFGREQLDRRIRSVFFYS